MKRFSVRRVSSVRRETSGRRRRPEIRLSRFAGDAETEENSGTGLHPTSATTSTATSAASTTSSTTTAAAATFERYSVDARQ